MTLIDIIVLILIILSFVLIGYFCFWKNRNKPCHNCPYAKKCGGSCETKHKNKENKTSN